MQGPKALLVVGNGLGRRISDRTIRAGIVKGVDLPYEIIVLRKLGSVLRLMTRSFSQKIRINRYL